MPRVRVEKFGDNFYLQIDGQPKQFNRESSDLLTSPIEATEDFRSGIFSSGFVVKFSDGARILAIDFQHSFNSKETDVNPLAEIRRRVRLVQETFAKAEAEKEVWEGIVGELPLTEPEEVETFTIIYTGTQGQGYKCVIKTTRSLLMDKLSDFSNPIFIFKGEPETV